MLLNSPTRAAVRDGGLDSGRYTVKPRIEGSRREDRPVTKRITLEGPREVVPGSGLLGEYQKFCLDSAPFFV